MNEQPIDHPVTPSSRHVLFWLTLTVSLALIALVFISPLFSREERVGGWSRLLALFARDVAVRRTAITGALGLAVTARVFFRPTRAASDRLQLTRPAPKNVIGA